METGNVIKRTCKLCHLRRLRESVVRSRIEDKQLRAFFHLGIADRGRYEDSTPLRHIFTRLELAPWIKSARTYLVPNGIALLIYLYCMLLSWLCAASSPPFHPFLFLFTFCYSCLRPSVCQVSARRKYSAGSRKG
ncbi:hypothetical protein L208DRAFT_498963 [Tricholoma matsutake]|nr:hypothetical protein L208DRAFT_498963 [Tricholoma matsutake 945]